VQPVRWWNQSVNEVLVRVDNFQKSMLRLQAVSTRKSWVKGQEYRSRLADRLHHRTPFYLLFTFLFQTYPGLVNISNTISQSEFQHIQRKEQAIIDILSKFQSCRRKTNTECNRCTTTRTSNCGQRYLPQRNKFSGVSTFNQII